MLDLHRIVNDTDAVRAGLAKRGEDDAPIDLIIELDARRRSLIQQTDSARHFRNEVSRTIGAEKRRPTDDEIQQMRATGDRISALEEEARSVATELRNLMLGLPNVPLGDVPEGHDESLNVVVRESEPPSAREWDTPHWEIGESLGIIDMESAANMSGSRFYMLRGQGARLHRAIVGWLLDTLVDEFGYEETNPPFLVREETLVGSGNLPKFADDLYRDDDAGLWMIPTSEVSLNAIHQGSIIDGELPLKYCAHTPCFRKEHAAAGRDVRGMKRVKQFEKVEMFRFVEPDDSEEALEEMIEISLELCRRLGFTTRLLKLCAGDIAFQSAKTYDIEVWSPGAQEWLEISSLSTCTDFQTRRNNTRYRPKRGGGTRFPHTLNGSALGMPRTFIAVLENGLQADGSVVLPEVLWERVGVERVGVG